MERAGDILVVGAGIIGCSIAFELASRGQAVQIVDDRPAGMGATQASAGVLAPYIEAREEGPLLELTARGLDRFDDFVSRVASAAGSEIPYRRTGTLDVALSEEEFGKLQISAKLLADRGIPARLLAPAALRSEEPHVTDRAVGGLLISTHGFVVASELTRAASAAAVRAGARTLPPARVQHVRRRGDGLLVETNRSSITAHAVVIATGSWTGQIEIEGADPAPVRPIRGQLLHFGWKGVPLRRVTWSDRCYLVPWDDGTLLVGATVEDAGFDERNTVAGVRDLIEAASGLVPHACRASFQSARVGLRPATPDEVPIIGRSGALPNVIYAAGHYRNGVLLSPLTAELVAGMLIDDHMDPILESTRPARFGRL